MSKTPHAVLSHGMQVAAAIRSAKLTIAAAARLAGVNEVSLRNQLAGRKGMSETHANRVLTAIKEKLSTGPNKA